MDESSRLTNNDIQKANLLKDYFASVFTHEPHGYVPSTISIDSRKLRTWQSPTIRMRKSYKKISPGPNGYSLYVVGLLLINAAQIVPTPPAPRNGGPFLPF